MKRLRWRALVLWYFAIGVFVSAYLNWTSYQKGAPSAFVILEHSASESSLVAIVAWGLMAVLFWPIVVVTEIWWTINGWGK
ncbi:MAG TPA: hypothetical protein VFQ05_07365 [Candidatus Eisenbacteria bacterium]|nr:hypothetical protein [Candidatus Eisenbacteria bacterium]